MELPEQDPVAEGPPVAVGVWSFPCGTVVRVHDLRIY